MNAERQKHNWLLDCIIFLGFLLGFFLEITGVAVHQWLGLVVFALIIVHMFRHWNWIQGVFTHFFGKASTRSRFYALIDFLLLFGMVMIFETGLVISTWFNLDIANFSTWVDLHLYSSISTLVLTVVKIALHGKWIVNVANKIFKKAPLSTAPAMQTNGPQAVSRRQFLATMGVVTLGSVVAIANVWPNKKLIQDAIVADAQSGSTATQQSTATQAAPTATEAQLQATQPAATATTAAQPTATATVQPTAQTVTTCQTSCRRGNHCAYPGVCHDYRDTNGNGLCDLGECA